MKKYLFGVAALLLGVSSYASAATLNNTFTVGSSYPDIGSSAQISSSCGTAPGSVSFYVTQNGQVTNLSTSNNLTTSATGEFSGNITYPNSITPGAATLTATCANGDVITTPLTFQAAATPSFSIASQPTVGGQYALNGACGGSGGGGNAQISLSSNGINTPLQTVNLSNVGTFTTNVYLPTNYSTGNATISAHCSNGSTISSPVTVSAPAISSVSMNISPHVGANDTVSGSCSTADANGMVKFSLIKNGVTTPLIVNNANSNSSGYFNSTLSYPNGFETGPATLLITCPTGGTYANPITISAASASTTQTDTTTPCDAACVAAATGAAASTIPVGGVDAGRVVSSDFIVSELLFLILGAIAVSLYGYRVTRT